MIDIKFNPVLKWIYWRIKKHKNVIIIINGPTGSGKTYSALRLAVDIAAELGTPFSIEKNLDFSFTGLLRKTMLPENELPGTCFVFEEVGSIGSGSASSSWQSKANRFFHSFLQTTRHRRQILIFTCPNFSDLDARARRLIHMQMEMLNINFSKKLAYLKAFILQSNNRTGKLYFKFLRFKSPEGGGKLKRVSLGYPPQELVDVYEKEKKKFTTKLNQTILDESEPKRKDKNGTKIYYDIMDELIRKGGLTYQAIADRCNCSVSSVRIRKKMLKSDKI